MHKKVCLYIILLTTFLDWMGISLVYPLFSAMLYQPEGMMLPDGISEIARATVLGLLLAATSISEFLFAPFLGVFSDSHGRKKVIIASLCCGVLGYTLSIFAVLRSDIVLLVISRFIVGISLANAGVAGAVISDISSQEEKSKNFVLYSLMCGSGFAFGSFIGGLLLQISYSAPFVFTAILTLVNMLVVMRYLPETNTPSGTLSVRGSFGFTHIKKAFVYPELRSIFTTVFLVVFGYSLYWEFVPIRQIREFGFSSQDVANMYSYGALFLVLSNIFLVQRVISRLGDARALMYAIFFFSIFVFLVVVFADPLFLWLYIPLQQFCLAIFYPTTTTLVSNIAQKEVQGEVLGMLTAVHSFGFVVAPLLGGLLLAASIALPLFVGAVSILAGALVFRRQAIATVH